MFSSTTLLRFQPATMSNAQQAAVSYLARYYGLTHSQYAYQLRQWFAWCESSGLDPLVEIQRAYVELYIRGLGDRGLMDSSVVTMMHAVRGYFRFAHIDGLIPSDPAVYARLPKVHRDESRTQGLDRLELIRLALLTWPPRWRVSPATALLPVAKEQRIRPSPVRGPPSSNDRGRGGSDRGRRPSRRSRVFHRQRGLRARFMGTTPRVLPCHP